MRAELEKEPLNLRGVKLTAENDTESLMLERLWNEKGSPAELIRDGKGGVSLVILPTMPTARHVAPANQFLVGVQGNWIVVGLPRRVARMSREDALSLAAWLVSMATNNPSQDFLPILAAVLEG
jgi:hypothetical protein